MRSRFTPIAAVAVATLVSVRQAGVSTREEIRAAAPVSP